ncbi:MAG: hypothetical protein SPL89_03585, partial [Clostridia bacterium]|nr:hypothetical protein [Clostridia bacterium]
RRIFQVMNFVAVQGKSTADTTRICEHFDAVMCKIHLEKRVQISKRAVRHVTAEPLMPMKTI